MTDKKAAVACREQYRLCIGPGRPNHEKLRRMNCMLDDILPRDILALGGPYSDLPFSENLPVTSWDSRSRPHRERLEQVTRTGCVQKLVVPGHAADRVEVNAFEPAGLDLHPRLAIFTRKQSCGASLHRLNRKQPLPETVTALSRRATKPLFSGFNPSP